MDPKEGDLKAPVRVEYRVEVRRTGLRDASWRRAGGQSATTNRLTSEPLGNRRVLVSCSAALRMIWARLSSARPIFGDATALPTGAARLGQRDLSRSAPRHVALSNAKLPVVAPAILPEIGL